MRRLLVSAVAVLLFATACSGEITNTQPHGDGQNSVGGLNAGYITPTKRELAPDLSGTTLTGTPLDVEALKGQVVVLNFWASWCGPCRGEADNLVSVYQQTHALGVDFVGIDIHDEQSSAQSTVVAEKVPYPSLFDGDGTLLLKFRGQAPQEPPTTMILDRQGRVADRFLGPVTVSDLLGPVQAIAKEPA